MHYDPRVNVLLVFNYRRVLNLLCFLTVLHQCQAGFEVLLLLLQKFMSLSEYQITQRNILKAPLVYIQGPYTVLVYFWSFLLLLLINKTINTMLLHCGA